jgi:hypothetical protein
VAHEQNSSGCFGIFLRLNHVQLFGGLRRTGRRLGAVRPTEIYTTDQNLPGHERRLHRSKSLIQCFGGMHLVYSRFLINTMSTERKAGGVK